MYSGAFLHPFTRRSKRFWLQLYTGLLIGLGLCYAGAEERQPRLVGTVIKVTDGDTATVLLSSGSIVVRFDSIDSPERSQPWGREATRALEHKIGGREVSLEVVTQDRYERLVAVVYLGAENVNAYMVREGHAWAYREYLKDESYCHLEGHARSERRGLWQLERAQRPLPSDYRKRQRGQSVTRNSVSEESVTACIAAMGQSDVRRSAARVAPSPTQTSGCLIKGNISQSGRIYHLPGSRYYEQTKIDQERGERWFCTEQEAVAAGWRPAR